MKINIQNSEKITAALAAVNGRASRHAYTLAEEIREIAAEAEAALADCQIARSRRGGARVRSTSGTAVPNSYQGRRAGTAVTLSRSATGAWFLIDAARVDLYTAGGGLERVTLPEPLEGVVRRHGNCVVEAPAAHAVIAEADRRDEAAA